MAADSVSLIQMAPISETQNSIIRTNESVQIYRRRDAQVAQPNETYIWVSRVCRADRRIDICGNTFDSGLTQLPSNRDRSNIA